MPITKQKQPWKRVLHSRITPFVLAAACLFLAVSVYERYTIEREMAARRIEAEIEREEMRERKHELETKVEYLTAEYGVEAEMRKNFDVAKEGERVVIIVENEDSGIDPLTSDEPVEAEEEGFWARMMPW